AMRDEIEPLQAQDMVQPNRAGMAHRSTQHLAEGFEQLHFKACGIEAGKTPALAERIERIGRRADAKLSRDRDLFVPGIETVGLHTDGDVQIESDLHAEAFRELLAGGQLAIGDPLHELDEFDLAFVGTGAELRAFRVIRLSPLLWPFPPRRLE